LAALPLVKRRADRHGHIQIVPVHSVLAIAAGVLSEWQTIADQEIHDEPAAH
jgi:hypothetical protein